MNILDEKSNEKVEKRLPVYMSRRMKEELEMMKFEIWKLTGKSVSLTQLIRDAIEDQLKNHRKEAVLKYKN